MSNKKYILLIERGDLGIQNFAPDAGLVSFQEARKFIEQRRQIRAELELPEEIFYIAKVSREPITGTAVDTLWHDGAEGNLFS